MTLSVSGLAPLKINSTVLPIEGLEIPPEVASTAFRHSGNEYPSVLTIPGAAPRVRFRTPAKTAYDLLSFRAIQATTFDIWLSDFTSGLRQTSGHKMALATSAKALCYIRAIRCADRGIAMAECEAVLISSNGTSHPLADPASGTFPTLVSEPTLHTLGTTLVNSAGIAGCSGVDVDLGPQIVVGLDGKPGDGLLYPTVAQYVGATPIVTVEHRDPLGVLTALGYTGAALASNFVQWFRTYDATNQVTLTTGFSITAASGRAIPTDIRADNLALPRHGFRVDGLSGTTTHPLVVGTGNVP